MKYMLLQISLGAVVLATVGAAILLPRMRREARIAERLQVLRLGAEVTRRSDDGVLLAALQRVGDLVVASGMLRGKSVEQVRQTVGAAGMRSHGAAARFIGAKLLLFLGSPLLATLLLSGAEPMTRNLAIPFAAIVGLLAPDFALRNLRARHRKAVGQGLPDALDLLVICAEAGLPLEASVERVSAEMVSAAPAISAEFATTASEMRILPDRRTALTNIGDRTGLEPMRRLGGTLAQTLQYGTPLTQALRVLSAELRHEMLMHFEARAARLPAVLTVPTILFILPCIFLVVGGPAILRVLDVLSHQ